MSKKILIVGGGTGGHISPGIAIYEECLKNNFDVYLLVGNSDRKFKYLKEIEEKRLLSYGAPTLTKNIFKLPLFTIKFILAILKMKNYIRKMDIRYVIGMGGYVSAPALLAAKSLNVPIYLCEQNTVPGRVTQYFAKHANKIFTTFKDSNKFIKEEYQHKIFCVGNPVRKSVLDFIEKNDAKKHFNLQHCEKVILAIGGSQGAVKINELIQNLKINYSEELKNVGIIWCTGKYSFETYRSKVYENSDMGSIYISPFIDNVGIAYAACDLAIARSGAGVMMELAAKAVPSIFIPYPHAAMDHQTKNAEDFTNSGASVTISNNDAVPEVVGPVIFDLLSNSRKLKQMSQKMLENAKIDSTEKIISLMMVEE